VYEALAGLRDWRRYFSSVQEYVEAQREANTCNLLVDEKPVFNELHFYSLAKRQLGYSRHQLDEFQRFSVIFAAATGCLTAISPQALSLFEPNEAIQSACVG
jgi:hypothetical protein